jgi:branched-chain amino acid transport system substrate-binding protein
MTRSLILGVALALALLAPPATAETVKVGLIMSASGPWGTWGAQTMGGVRVYRELHGTSVGGNEIEIILRDDGGPNPGRAKQLAEELIVRDKVQFLAGFVFSPNVLAVADLITKSKMPTIITNASTASLTRRSPYLVRVSFTIHQQNASLGTWAAKHGFKTADTLYPDYVSGNDANEAFSKAYRAGGGTLINQISVPIDVIDFSPYSQRILQDKPQAIFGFSTGGANSLLLIRSWSDRLKPAGIAFFGPGGTEGTLQSVGDAAVGLISASQYPEHADNPLNRALWEQWAKDFPDQPDFLPDFATVAMYDALELIYRAVEKLGPRATGDEAMAFFKGRTVASPRGSFTIDPKERDVIQNIYVQRVEKRDGRLVSTTIDVISDMKDPWKEDHPE